MAPFAPLGATTRWNDHTAAGQQWQGDAERVVYNDARAGEDVLVSVGLDGGGHPSHDPPTFFPFRSRSSCRCGRKGKKVDIGWRKPSIWPANLIHQRTKPKQDEADALNVAP